MQNTRYVTSLVLAPPDLKVKVVSRDRHVVPVRSSETALTVVVYFSKLSYHTKL